MKKALRIAKIVVDFLAYVLAFFGADSLLSKF